MEITDIKSLLTILQVLQHYHLKPDKNNRLLCPFHNDKTHRCKFILQPIPFVVVAVTAMPAPVM